MLAPLDKSELTATPLRRDLARASVAICRREFSLPQLESTSGIGRTLAIAVKAFSYVSSLSMRVHQEQGVAVHESLSTVIYENGFRPTGEPPF